MRPEQIRTRICAVSACTTLGTLFAFAAVLRALEPPDVSPIVSLLRLALHGTVCFALGTVLAWSSASRALSALRSADHAAPAAGLDSAHHTPARFAAGSYAVWMLCASVAAQITRVARANKKLVEGIVQSVREQTKAATHVVGVIEQVSAQAERIRSAAGDQQQGNDLVLEQAGAMKDVAKQVHRTADEQSRGTRLIVETIENVRVATDRMATSVSEQTAGCSRAVAAIWEVFKRAKENHEVAGGLASGVDRVRTHANRVDDLVIELRSPRG